jgi:hypothetical protein
VVGTTLASWNTWPKRLEVKGGIIVSIGSTHKWALYGRDDYDKLEDEEALDVFVLQNKYGGVWRL